MSTTLLTTASVVGLIIVLVVAYAAVKLVLANYKKVKDEIRNTKLDKTINFVHQQINNAVYAMNAVEDLTGVDIPDSLQRRTEQIAKVFAKVDGLVSPDVADYIKKNTLSDWEEWLEVQISYHIEGITKKREEEAARAGMFGQGMKLG